MGWALNLKQGHDADVEKVQKRQLLKAEMARCTPELEPPHLVRFLSSPSRYCAQYCPSLVEMQVPLLDRPADVELT